MCNKRVFRGRADTSCISASISCNAQGKRKSSFHYFYLGLLQLVAAVWGLISTTQIILFGIDAWVAAANHLGNSYRVCLLYAFLLRVVCCLFFVFLFPLEKLLPSALFAVYCRYHRGARMQNRWL